MRPPSCCSATSGVRATVVLENATDGAALAWTNAHTVRIVSNGVLVRDHRSLRQRVALPERRADVEGGNAMKKTMLMTVFVVLAVLATACGGGGDGDVSVDSDHA